MSDTERAYNDYRLNLLAQAIIQINEEIGYVIDPSLESRIRENFQYNFGDDYYEEEEK